MPKRGVAVVFTSSLQRTQHAADGASAKDAKRMAPSFFVSLLLAALLAAVGFLQSQLCLTTG